jgi:poly(hydroxyalkanoate) depolymerase family esterase
VQQPDAGLDRCAAAEKGAQVASLGRTTARLARIQRHWGQILASHGADGQSGSTHLVPVTEFGSNPGRLKLYVHVPARLAPSPGLVVVLHGCTQTAAGYDLGAGWSTLADRYGFVVLYPEQQPENNPRTCFNWFRPADITRGRGEAASIAQMVNHAIKTYGIDRKRVFVTGLSAGGAMTAAMLATYPDLFAGGAIIAGLPYRAAGTVQEALDAMFQGGSRPASEWGDFVRGASRHRGSWPRVSIWHGGADTTVVPANASELIKQWTNVHGLPEKPAAEEVVDGYPRQVWRGPDGGVLVESYALPSMAHGTPLAVGPGEDALGRAGPFLLDVGISSSYHIAKFWGLTGERLVQPHRPSAPTDHRATAEHPPHESRAGLNPGTVIAKALKAAGLMKG